MNSKYFEEPKLEIIHFDNTDVITTSYSGGADYEDGGEIELDDDDVLLE